MNAVKKIKLKLKTYKLVPQKSSKSVHTLFPVNLFPLQKKENPVVDSKKWTEYKMITFKYSPNYN